MDQVGAIGHGEGFARSHDLGEQGLTAALLDLHPGVASGVQHDARPRHGVGSITGGGVP
jgi:hypothetical protein